MTRPEFTGIMAYLIAGVGKPMSQEQVDVYFDLLGDLPRDAFAFAAKRALIESTFPVIPPAGTLRKLAAECTQPDEPNYAEAWYQVLRAVARYGLSGRDRVMDTLPDTVARAARCLWQVICDCEPRNIGVAFAQFRDAYKTIQERQQRIGLLPAALVEESRRLQDEESIPTIGGDVFALVEHAKKRREAQTQPKE